MNDKEKAVKRLEEICLLTDELESERKELSALLMEAMTNKEELIADYIVKKVTVVKYKPSIEQATELGAVIMKPTIDMKVIKKLSESGVEFPKDEFSYLKITKETE